MVPFRSSGGGLWHGTGSCPEVWSFVIPDATYNLVRSKGSAGGIAISQQALWKRLGERGLLQGSEQSRSTLKVRRTVEEARRTVLYLDAMLLCGNEDEVDPENPKTWPDQWRARYSHHCNAQGNTDAARYETLKEWRRDDPSTAPNGGD